MRELNITLETTGLHGGLFLEQPLTTVLQNTAIAILIFDAEGHLLFTNPAGRKLADHCELKLGQRLPVDSGCESFRQLLDKAKFSQASLAGEVVLPGQRVFAAEIIPIQEGSCVFLLSDVSRLKEVEKQKNEFIALAVHDLRTPITSIIGFNHLLRRAGPLNDSQSDFVQRIHHAAENMTALVENMRNQAKMDLYAESQNEELDISRLIREIADELQPQAEAKRQLLALGNTAPQAKVQGNRLQLRQAFCDLIGNAIKHTPEGGTVVLSLDEEAGFVKIKIKDSGYGIPPADLPHIFERSYRDRNSKQVYLGSNSFGLAIVKSIIEGHQGTIDLQSEPGQGSCFTVSLPCSSRKELPTAVLKQEQETAYI